MLMMRKLILAAALFGIVAWCGVGCTERKTVIPESPVAAPKEGPTKSGETGGPGVAPEPPLPPPKGKR